MRELPSAVLHHSWNRTVLPLDEPKKPRVVEVVGVVGGERLPDPTRMRLLVLLVSNVVLGWLITIRNSTLVLSLVLVVDPVGMGVVRAV